MKKPNKKKLQLTELNEKLIFLTELKERWILQNSSSETIPEIN